MTEIGQLNGIGLVSGFLEFLEEFQRRGVHVNILKIGSRVGFLCFGGI
jgi:hypothetical protein